MRHNKNFNHLGRQAGHRKAMLSNMATSLILHKRIETTVAKAKAVQRFVEPLVTKSKEDTTHSRRIVFSYLKQKEAVTELFRTIAPKISERPGGYTRILKTGFRLGDAADMCIIEFVDFNEPYTLGIAPAADIPAHPKQNRNGTSVRTTQPGFLLRCTKNRFRLMSCLKPFACNRKSPQQKQGLCKQPLFNLRSVWRYWK